MEKLTTFIDNIIEKLCTIGDFIYKYRYYIAVIAFILCIILEISGSSIGMWKNVISTGEIKDGVLFGNSREIRSDEWAVLTPMTFSQKFDGFNYFSNIIRGDSTDVFMIYGLPVLSILQIFRPFQLGFLFLGNAKGLSFFWCGRLIALYLVSFELNMIISKKNKLLSTIGAIMITLAPIVQWWFAVNGIAEIFIFGGLAIILLKKFLSNQDFKKRCLYSLLLTICAVGYVIVLYPSWQVPMAYVFAILAIWVIADEYKETKVSKKDIALILGVVILCLVIMIYIFSKSLNTINTVMNTVYPGARNESGGTAKLSYFDYIMNVFMPFKSDGLITNTCEKSLMFGLFPAGIIIAITSMYKERKKDLLLILLLSVYTFLSIWCIIGFPKILATITLLKNSQAQRTMLAVGFLDVLILIRALSIMKKPIKKRIAITLTVFISVIMVYMCNYSNKVYVSIKMGIVMLLMCIYLFYFAFRYKAKYSKYLFAGGILLVMLTAGGTINPIRSGIGVIYKNELITEIQSINNKESGKWIAEGFDFPVPNYILMAGVATINSTNTYPDLDRWYSIDVEKKYENIYNRYAHIKIILAKSDKDYKEKFELKQADVFEVYLLPEELKQLQIKYVFTQKELEKYSTDKINFEKIYSNNNYNIYKIDV